MRAMEMVQQKQTSVAGNSTSPGTSTTDTENTGAGSTTTVDDGIVAGHPTPQTPSSQQGVVATQTKAGTKPGPKPYTKPVGFDEAGLPYDKVTSDQKNAFVFGATKRYTTTSFTKDDLYNTEKFPWRTVISLENGDLAVATRIGDLDKGETPVLMVFSSTDETWVAVKPIYANDQARQAATVQQRDEVVNETCDAITYGSLGLIAAPLVTAATVELAPVVVAAAGDALAGAGATAGAIAAPGVRQLSKFEFSRIPQSVTRVFWTGGEQVKDAAAGYARSIGGKTLEMTRVGRVLEAVGDKLPRSFMTPLWNAASSQLASSARGAASVVQNGQHVRVPSTWSSVEYPILMRNGVSIDFFNLTGGVILPIP